jgi:hypothetical protein
MRIFVASNTCGNFDCETNEEKEIVLKIELQIFCFE